MSSGSDSCDDRFLACWKSLGEKSSATIRLFDRGDFFTIHQDDAILASKVYFKNPGSLKFFTTNTSQSPYINIKKTNVEFFRYFLLKRQYRIEIYNSNTKSGRDNEWTLTCKASPGNLSQLEDLLSTVDIVEASGLLAINIKQSGDGFHVFLAYCHTDSRVLLVGEFVDSPQLANLETAIVQVEARECLVPCGLISDDSETKNSKSTPNMLIHLPNIFERACVLVTETKKSDFSSVDIAQDLSYLLRKNKSSSTTDLHAFLKENNLQDSLACVAAIIKFLNLKGDESWSRSFTMDRFSLDNFVRLDSAALRALHLLPGPDDTNRHQSVYGILNRCRTPQGQRLLSQWIRQPLTDTTQINERLDLVEFLVNESVIRQSLHNDFLRRLPDLQKLARRLKRYRAGLQDVFLVYQAVETLPNVRTTLLDYTGEHMAVVKDLLIHPLEESIGNFSKYSDMVQTTIDLPLAESRGEFLVKPEFDPSLKEIKSKMNNLEDRISNQYHRVAQQLGLQPGRSIKLDLDDLTGFFMRVTKKEEKTLRDYKSLEIIDTQKGGVRFRNSTFSELNEQYQELNKKYLETQKSIVEEIVKIAAGYMEPIYQLSTITAHIDVYTSLAVVAVSAPISYVRPKLIMPDDIHKGEVGDLISDSTSSPPFSKRAKINPEDIKQCSRIILRETRHPCLEMQEGISVIPNDVHLERGKQIFILITGPNMGGKSTYIRGVGVVVAMAQIGSFVPCSYAELTPVDAIMARVGAADCQLKGVSTFLAEMLETAAVLKSATNRSLVIIDELGRGTSTFDGFGLAWAIAHHLVMSPQLRCFSLFATHFHALTSLATCLPRNLIANYRVNAQVLEPDAINSLDSHANEVVMLYKVEPGVCDRSYGLDVARLVGLPSDVIQMANQSADEEEQLESLWLLLDKLVPSQDTSENCHNVTNQAAAVRFAEYLLPVVKNILADSDALKSDCSDAEYRNSLLDELLTGLPSSESYNVTSLRKLLLSIT